MPSTKLSVVLITLNEAANLPRTLASLRFGPDIELEIVVVDSGSADRTVELAREAGACVLTEPWKGFGRQKNFAIAHATGDWILSLDADEELSRELATEIAALLHSPDAQSAYRIPRLNHFLGRPLRHGGYWPDPKLRLFRPGAALYEERDVHEAMRPTKAAEGRVGQLKGHLIHHCYPTLDEYIEHMNRYSSTGARMLVERGRAPRSLAGLLTQATLNPALTFVYNYALRLGFLDGAAGLLQHLNHSAYIHWKYVKAWQLARQRPRIS